MTAHTRDPELATDSAPQGKTALTVVDCQMPKANAKTLGLCMIVKNEAHVIINCLESVHPLVDYVLVEDTGSTDGTQTIVKNWLRDHDMPGEVLEEKWRDFAYNRTFALTALRRRKDVDYALMMDADDVVQLEPNFDSVAFKNGLTADLYHVLILLRDVSYERPQICSNRIEFLYRGVLHEFIDTPDGANSWGGGTMNVAFAKGLQVCAGLLGSRNIDPQKYQRDTEILRHALKSESNKFLRSRYTFYLAQSLRDAGQKRQALKMYEQRAEMGFWHEERAISLYNAGELKAALNYPETEVIGTYLAAFEMSPNRLEPLHAATRFCRLHERFHQGYVIAKGAVSLSRQVPQSGLFIQKWVYEYGLLDEYSVVAYWAGQYRDCLDASLTLLADGKLPADMRARVRKNADFAQEKLALDTDQADSVIPAAPGPPTVDN